MKLPLRPGQAGGSLGNEQLPPLPPAKPLTEEEKAKKARATANALRNPKPIKAGFDL
jgi:hypothetical protein